MVKKSSPEMRERRKWEKLLHRDPKTRKLFAGGQFTIDTPIFHPDQTKIDETCPYCGIPRIEAEKTEPWEADMCGPCFSKWVIG